MALICWFGRPAAGLSGWPSWSSCGGPEGIWAKRVPRRKQLPSVTAAQTFEFSTPLMPSDQQQHRIRPLEVYGVGAEVYSLTSAPPSA